MSLFLFFFQAEDGIRDLVRSRGLGDVYKRQLCASHVSQVEEHVGNIKLALEDQQRRNVMGLDSDTQSITISCKTSPSGKLKTIENVLDALRESLLGSEPFVLVPIDCISNISNIKPCLLYTSDAADEEDSVNIGGRRRI
eukprot:TRINITY_DN53147_c0_g1_i1.p1 TRINITY_DN53147_c0_g1~~TRINITY_DN53147_c0_g1_i1.p1  ORF type:complete len:140 (+),score=22.65 TRINITY_DN53147_c0_g1_i1:7-426(+)